MDHSKKGGVFDMRIDAYNQIQQFYKSSKLNKTEGKKPAVSKFTDKFMLSDAAKDAQLAKQAADNAPDVRAELVNPLKERIANGTYEVSTEDFASRLLSKYNGLF